MPSQSSIALAADPGGFPALDDKLIVLEHVLAIRINAIEQRLHRLAGETRHSEEDSWGALNRRLEAMRERSDHKYNEIIARLKSDVPADQEDS